MSCSRDLYHGVWNSERFGSELLRLLPIMRIREQDAWLHAPWLERPFFHPHVRLPGSIDLFAYFTRLHLMTTQVTNLAYLRRVHISFAYAVDKMDMTDDPWRDVWRKESHYHTSPYHLSSAAPQTDPCIAFAVSVLPQLVRLEALHFRMPVKTLENLIDGTVFQERMWRILDALFPRLPTTLTEFHFDGHWSANTDTWPKYAAYWHQTIPQLGQLRDLEIHPFVAGMESALEQTLQLQRLVLHTYRDVYQNPGAVDLLCRALEQLKSPRGALQQVRLIIPSMDIELDLDSETGFCMPRDVQKVTISFQGSTMSNICQLLHALTVTRSHWLSWPTGLRALDVRLALTSASWNSFWTAMKQLPRLTRLSVAFTLVQFENEFDMDLYDVSDICSRDNNSSYLPMLYARVCARDSHDLKGPPDNISVSVVCNSYLVAEQRVVTASHDRYVWRSNGSGVPLPLYRAVQSASRLVSTGVV